MRIPDGNAPMSGTCTEKWEDWMDAVELKWHQTIEAARLEYTGVRDAIQAKPVTQTPPARFRDENIAE